MNNVQFDDQQNVQVVRKKSGLTQMVINAGLAKDAKGAQMILLIVAVVAILIGGFFVFSGGNDEPPIPPDAVLDGRIQQ